MKVVVFGASGKVGQLLVPALVSAGHEVVGVVRRPEAADDVTAAGATPALVDLEGPVEPVAEVLAGADAAAWVAGANVATGHEHSDRVDRDANLRVIAAADGAGIGHWVQVSSLYADRIDQAPPVLHHFLGNKVQADDAVRASSMTWNVVRASGLSGDDPTGLVTAQREGMGYGMLPRADLAATVTTLITDNPVPNTSFDLTGGGVAIDQALASLG
jgi:uncharacterized protein YbjT (DUF2867 family)